MTARYLTESDVTSLLDLPTAITLVEEAFRQLALEKADNQPRVRASAPGIMLHTLSAAAEYLSTVGLMSYTTTKSGAKFHVLLYDGQTGALTAMIEANRLGQLRTGAASGVATQYMARRDAADVGLLGTGFQARTQLEAVCHVRRIRRVDVFSRDVGRREEFARAMSQRLDVEVTPVHSPDEAVDEKDIIITATTSRTPTFDGRSLAEGTHINAVGSNSLRRAELDSDAIRRSDIIVCDSIEQCQREAGDFNQALELGVTDWRLMHELSAVVAGHQSGRSSDEQVTLFKSVGLGIEDIAVGAHILERAIDEGIGQELPF